MKTRNLSQLIVSAIIALTLTGTSPASAVGCGTYSGGSGTSAEPYLISTAADLQAIETDGCFAAYFKQTADISLSGITWTSIGTSADFTGSYNGQNFTVSDLTVSYSDSGPVGLFGTISGAEIRNLRIKNATVTSTGTGGAGIVAGLTLNASTIEKIAVVGGTVTGVRETGGITGMTQTGSTQIANVSVDANITSSGGNGGGIVGQDINSATITNASFKGTVDADGQYSGGIVGYGLYADIDTAYSVGTISGDVDHRGGIFAAGSGIHTVENSYFLDTGVVEVSSDWATSKTATELRTISTYETVISRSPDPWSITDDLASAIAGTATEDWLIHPSINSGYPLLLWEFEAGYDLKDFSADDFYVAESNQVVAATTGSSTYAGTTLDYVDWILTDDANDRAGAVWSKNRLDLTDDFEINAEIYLGDSDNGGHGLAFVLQSSSSNSLTTSGFLGYSEIVPALAVEFDTYANGTGDGDHGQATNDFWGIHNNDDPNVSSANRSKAVVPDNVITDPDNLDSKLYSLGDIEDGNWRAVRFTWDAATETLDAMVDNNRDGDFVDSGELLSKSGLSLTGAGSTFGSTPVWWGFTASTLGFTGNEQRVRFRESTKFVGTSLVNSPPVIQDKTVSIFNFADGAQTVDFTISDDQTTQAQWSVSATSSSSPTATVTSAITSASNARLTVTPVANGTTTITLTLTDADGATASRTLAVSFASLPSAPSSVSTVGGYSQAALSWSAPAGDTGTPLTGYRIESSTDSGATWVTQVASTGSSETTAVVGDLTPGTEYSFRVAAINALGTGSTASSSGVVIQRLVITPYLGPISRPLARTDAVAGEEATVSGYRLDVVEKVSIGDQQLEIVSSTSSELVILVPENLSGLVNLNLEWRNGAKTGIYNVFEALNVLQPDIQETAEADKPSTQKVNAGSFKGYVAVYALGYEGQRLSAKIGNDWVIVEDIPSSENNLFRVTDFTGAGYDISVRIFIDRELVMTMPLKTR